MKREGGERTQRKRNGERRGRKVRKNTQEK